MSTIPSQALDLIKSFEGFERVIPGSNPTVVEQYDDGTGTFTIGYGTTSADVSPLPSRLTEPQAAALLSRKLATKYMPVIDGLRLPLNDNQRSALVSFIYNVGPGGVDSSTTVGRQLRAHNWHAAADALLAWDRAGGVVLPGLLRRRQAERALFLKADDPNHYGWFTPRERPVVEEYDRLRALQSKTRHPHQLRLAFLRARLRFFSLRVAVIAHQQKEKNGKPSWGRFHRGWRRIELSDRAKGERKV